MATQENEFADQIVASADKKRPVPVPEVLLRQLQQLPHELKFGNRVIPMRTVWLAAASIALLIAINVVTYSTTREYRSASGIYADYFSYLDQL